MPHLKCDNGERAPKCQTGMMMLVADKTSRHASDDICQMGHSFQTHSTYAATTMNARHSQMHSP